MASFQKIVLVIAVFLLIITLVIIGVALGQAKSDESWPPLIGDCPDYWADLGGDGAKCVNKNSLGTCNIPTKEDVNSMDFTGPVFTGDNGDCAKYTWARRCGVTWDGINSGVSNPCINNDDDDDNDN
jgi:hypothetical protein